MLQEGSGWEARCAPRARPALCPCLTCARAAPATGGTAGASWVRVNTRTPASVNIVKTCYSLLAASSNTVWGAADNG